MDDRELELLERTVTLLTAATSGSDFAAGLRLSMVAIQRQLFAHPEWLESVRRFSVPLSERELGNVADEEERATLRTWYALGVAHGAAAAIVASTTEIG